MGEVGRVSGGATGISQEPSAGAEATATVQDGERSLADVAQRLNISEKSLKEANPQIKNPGRLIAGQEIHLPQTSQARSQEPPTVTGNGVSTYSASGKQAKVMQHKLEGNVMQASLNSKMNVSSQTDKKDQISFDDPRIQKLDDGVKAQLQFAIQKNARNDAAKADLKKLAVHPGFGKLSPERQQELIKLQAKHPEQAQNILRLAESLGFHKMGAAQSEVLKRMERDIKNPAKVDNLTNLVAAPGFAGLSAANRTKMLNALDDPKAGELGKNFKDLSPVYSGLPGNDRTQTAILDRLIKNTYNGNKAKIADMVDVVTYGNFGRLSDAHQQQMLKLLDAGTGHGKDLNLMLQSNGWRRMTPELQNKTLNGMVSYYNGDTEKVRGAANVIGAPNFSNLSPDMQDWMLDALQATNGNPKVAQEMAYLADNERFHLFNDDESRKAQIRRFIKSVEHKP